MNVSEEFITLKSHQVYIKKIGRGKPLFFYMVDQGIIMNISSHMLKNFLIILHLFFMIKLVVGERNLIRKIIVLAKKLSYLKN
ncbi:hypothetical protein BAGA_19410 [Bacillus gaemokensis]|uniref:Uncharacterized protein n=1 Tax=Bacillus gaemokensis TaxID=574375 RepID=A0A073K7G1_9BACI|nr:hypothetical protein BAGA_19410 [Bacillus gaemokensis]KYG25889.1 hypothetical protein AZF08_17840 [Bacillus gaemokensis]